jgi:hypothetical protein
MAHWCSNGCFIALSQAAHGAAGQNAGDGCKLVHFASMKLFEKSMKLLKMVIYSEFSH